jgi:hypothetical protein
VKSGREALEKKAFEKYKGDVAAPEIRAALKALPAGKKIKLAADDPPDLGGNARRAAGRARRRPRCLGALGGCRLALRIITPPS